MSFHPEHTRPHDGCVVTANEKTSISWIGITRALNHGKPGLDRQPRVGQEIRGHSMNRIGRKIIYAVLVIVVLLVIWQILTPL